MQRTLMKLAAAASFSLIATGALSAAEISQPAETTSVAIAFGNAGSVGVGDAVHAVTPPMVALERGVSYELVFTNPSNETHYLQPEALSDAVRTMDFVVDGGRYESTSTLGPRGHNPLGSIVGRVEEVELRAGGKATWRFTAMVPGTYQIECGIPTHAAAGMKAVIIVR